MKHNFTALVYGATGAVGQDLVQHLLKSEKWSKIIVVVRRQLDQWKTHSNKNKLDIRLLEDMDQLLKPDQFSYQGVDCLFCMFGTQVKHGSDNFIKVDKTYPLMAAQIALKSKIPHYILVSSKSAHQNSWLFYLKIKGQVEAELRNKKLPLLSIFRPGLLANRHNARCGQKFIQCLCPCRSAQIQAIDCAEVLMITAQKNIQKSKSSNGVTQLYEHNDMLQILDSSQNSF